MSKVDLQLFKASIRVIREELEKSSNDVPKKVNDELSAMEHLIEQNLNTAN